jgi:hypothetical protein
MLDQVSTSHTRSRCPIVEHGPSVALSQRLSTTMSDRVSKLQNGVIVRLEAGKGTKAAGKMKCCTEILNKSA